MEGTWTLPAPVQIKGFVNEYPQVNYCVANSGRVLLMAIENQNSYGGMDLFVSFMQPDWTWSVPKNCGNVINTFSNEMTPFLSADDKTLYFSSYGHQGLGSADIFMTKRLDDSWVNWSPPVNVGTPINGPFWDAYFKVDAKGEYGYMVSTAEGGYGNEDIYRLQLADEIQPEAVVLIQGKVFDSETGEELSAQVHFEDLHANVSLGQGYAQKGYGYKITLPKGYLYGFQASLDGYIPVYETIELFELDNYDQREVDLYLTPIKDNQDHKLNTVTFVKGQLNETSQHELDQLSVVLTKNGDLTLDLSGMGSGMGPEGQNALRQYLIGRGVRAEQLILKAGDREGAQKSGKIMMKVK